MAQLHRNNLEPPDLFSQLRGALVPLWCNLLPGIYSAGMSMLSARYLADLRTKNRLATYYFLQLVLTQTAPR